MSTQLITGFRALFFYSDGTSRFKYDVRGNWEDANADITAENEACDADSSIVPFERAKVENVAYRGSVV